MYESNRKKNRLALYPVYFIFDLSNTREKIAYCTWGSGIWPQYLSVPSASGGSQSDSESKHGHQSTVGVASLCFIATFRVPWTVSLLGHIHGRPKFLPRWRIAVASHWDWYGVAHRAAKSIHRRGRLRLWVDVISVNYGIAFWNFSTSMDPFGFEIRISMRLAVFTATTALQLSWRLATDVSQCFTPQEFKNSCVMPAANWRSLSEVSSWGTPTVTNTSTSRLISPSAPLSDRNTFG